LKAKLNGRISLCSAHYRKIWDTSKKNVNDRRRRNKKDTTYRFD